jgi:hypothetical protein
MKVNQLYEGSVESSDFKHLQNPERFISRDAGASRTASILGIALTKEVKVALLEGSAKVRRRRVRLAVKDGRTAC